MFDWLVFSCCSHLERKASVKRFVSLQFLNLRHSVRLLRRVISPSQGRYLTQTEDKHRQTSVPRVGFEPTIPAFERAKTVHALNRAAAVISRFLIKVGKIYITVFRYIPEDQNVGSNILRPEFSTFCYCYNEQK
jgi:hypothetical protein